MVLESLQRHLYLGKAHLALEHSETGTGDPNLVVHQKRAIGLGGLLLLPKKILLIYFILKHSNHFGPLQYEN